MALPKTGFADAIVGTASFKVPLNANGNIAIDGDSVTGFKRISFNNLTADATKQGAATVADVFIKTLPGSSAGYYDIKQITFSVKWEVA